jgi:hypothetical protein
MRVRDSDRGARQSSFHRVAVSPQRPPTSHKAFHLRRRPDSRNHISCFHDQAPSYQHPVLITSKRSPNVPQAISPMHAHSSSSTVHTAQHPNIPRKVPITVPKELEEHENHVHHERKGDGPSRPQQKLND